MKIYVLLKIKLVRSQRKPITDISEFNEIQTIISEHPKSSFNKNYLITRFTNSGNLILTNSSFTQCVDGIMTKEKIDILKFKELAKQYFGI